jgi:hypothetical protein
MNKRVSTLWGIILILVGGLMLAGNAVFPMLGLNFWRWMPWRLWPLAVVGAGAFFILLPLLVRRKRGWGGLFILGVPVLVTGGILLFTSFFNLWDAWAWLWPLEVLGLAAGFVLAAISLRSVWLLVPAIIIGANGLLMQFCAITGWWGVWAVLWTVEPLSVGLALLTVFVKKRKTGLLIAGSILCGVAALGLIGMTALIPLSTVMPGRWIVNLIGPALLVGLGFLLLASSLVRRPVLREAAAE